MIDVWESEDDFRRFQTERLFPALQAAMGDAPPPSAPFESHSVTGVEALSRLS